MRAAVELVPAGSSLEIYEDLAEIPPFNQDEEQSPPEVVKKLKEKIRAADALLFAIPEYNYSVPGILKNAIDWASRPYGDSAWEGKPAAIMSASVGLGGVRAQYHLRQMFVFLNIHPLNRPEAIISNATDKYDPGGNLTDEDTKQHIKKLLEALIELTLQLRK